MKIAVAWVVGIWTLIQLAMLAVKLWVRTDWHWAVILIPTEAAGVALAAIGLLVVCMAWSLGRAWEGW